MTGTDDVTVTRGPDEAAHRHVCMNLREYNVKATDGMLRQPGIRIDLYLKGPNGEVIGGVICDTFSRCLYVDVLWIDERYRGKGHGEKLMEEAERIAKEAGCTFAHTTTFSYQSPGFYERMGYEVFGRIDDYPNGIIQYFLKKRL
jgi:ribosomal protein S18 acetylase RimI-like enzyme